MTEKTRARDVSNQSVTHADRGATGPAMLARNATITVIDDDTTADGIRRFTRQEVLRVRDTVLDLYAARGILIGRRLDAAARLAELYDAGKHAPTDYKVSGSHGGNDISDDRAAAWAAYCHALDAMPRRCQDACADIARNRWPTDLRAVPNLQDGFLALANLWREPPDKE